MERHSYFDVLIVGGGPSGSTAAIWASALNLKTLIIERDSFPRDKTCGDNLPPLTFELLDEINLTREVIGSSSFHNVDNIYLNGKDQHLTLPMEQFQCGNIPRQSFDQILWNNIGESIKKIEKVHITEIKFDSKTNNYIISFKKDDKFEIVSSKYIIAADGASSWIRKNSKKFEKFELSYKTASRAYASRGLQKHPLEINYPNSNSNDYYWQFAIAGNRTNVGYYQFFNTQSSSITKRELLKTFEKQANLEIDWETYKGAPIPVLTSETKNFANQNIFLIGDAAGLCEPMFGHGIDVGMLSAKVAIQFIHLEKNKKWFSKNFATKKYNKFIQEHIRPHILTIQEYIENTTVFDLNELIQITGHNFITNFNSIEMPNFEQPTKDKASKILNFINPPKVEDLHNFDDFEKTINSTTTFTLIEETYFRNIHEIIVEITKNKIPGDIINIGIYKGGGSLYMKALFEDLGMHKKWFLFDSFCGFKNDTIKQEKDLASLKLFSENLKYTNNYPSKQDVEQLFKKFNLDTDLTVIEGFIENTLHHYSFNKIAFLHLDVDFFEPTMFALQELYDKVQVGGWIIIDDYFVDMFNCKEAVDQFIKSNNINCEIIRLGQYAAGWRKEN